MGEHAIIFTGRLLPGTDREAFVAEFAARSGIGPDRARAIVEAGREVVLKRGLAAAEAMNAARGLEAMGMEVRIDPPPGAGDMDAALDAALSRAGDGSGEGEDAAAGQGPPPPPSGDGAGKPPRARGRGASPRARLARGWRWITSALDLVRAAPADWGRLLAAFAGVVAGLRLVPLIGSLALAWGLPALLGGIMLAAQAQQMEGGFRVETLFDDFLDSDNLIQHVIIGVTTSIYGFIVMMVLLGLAAVLAIGLSLGGMVTAHAGGGVQALGALFNPAMLLFAIIGILLYVPVSMVYALAPPLIALDGFSAMEAARYSITTCVKNALSFLPWLGMCLAVAAGTVLAGTLLGFIPLLGTLLSAALCAAASGVLVFLPMYFAYRDLFYSEERA